MRHALALAALVVSALLACAPREGSPEVAYRAFVRAVSDRDADRAWPMLSSDTQQWLEARARAVAQAAPGVVEPSARQLIIGTAARAGPGLVNVLVLRESRDLAILAVEEEGGAKREVEMVRQKTWRVRIPPPQRG